MKNSVRDHEKMLARREMLRESPEKRLEVDTAALKGISSFLEFVCHAECSVARGEAIARSDIDMALVISRFPIPERRQLEIVEVLRRQGFVAYHRGELRRSDPGYPTRMLEQIHFHTVDELTAMYETTGVLKPVVQAYIAGKRIDRDGERRRCRPPRKRRERNKPGLFGDDEFHVGNRGFGGRFGSSSKGA